MLSSLELYNDDVPRSAPVNMALDEIFWRTATNPRLRFYRWDHPAISFGYFGCYSDVASYANEWEIVRRCTGGGIVFHGTDLTYALIIPSGADGIPQSPVSVYTFVHQAVQRALAKSGVCARLVSDSSRSPETQPAVRLPNACFGNPIRSDVMVADQKVAGAAQRRSRTGLLQQGSIQNVKLPPDFQDQFAAQLAATSINRTVDPAVIEQATGLAAVKYATKEWLLRV
ncbi:MAG TPA: hypothetical protein VJ719_15750 [Chthoniobacterales bacterium]|nr:hypothetical protein [Chthoniobacterales bacterium]